MAEADYNNLVQRLDSTDVQVQSNIDAREKPIAVAREVIQDVIVNSVALSRCRTHVMGTRQERLTYMQSFPQAYWQSGTVDYPILGSNPSNADGTARAKDSQPKKMTSMKWNHQEVYAQELAVLVAIPDSYLDDTGAPLFDELRPRIAEAFALKIDAAILFGLDTPFLHGGIVENAIVAGNLELLGTGVDLAQDVAIMMQRASKIGLNITDFVSGPGFKWRLPQLRTQSGAAGNFPIYNPPISAAQPGTIWGIPVHEVRNSTWEDQLALLLGGEWDKAIVGIRQDLTFTMSQDATIFNPATGLVEYSSFQQDGKIMRAVMRLAFTVINPVRHLGAQYPFYILQDRSQS